MMHNWKRRLVHIAAAGIGVAAILPEAVSMRATPRPREIRIVVKDMAFYVDGDATANPVLRFRAGEEIRLVLRNEDGGMTHDFSVQGWKLATKVLREKGDEDSIRFTVPKQRGTIPYQCTPHSEMMKGTIQVD
jgi:plastocyanin